MDDIDDTILQKLEDEAARWVNEELAKRIIHAKEAIEEQVNVSQPEIGPANAASHLKKALLLAEENIRMDLELEAREWVDREMAKRASKGEVKSPE